MADDINPSDTGSVSEWQGVVDNPWRRLRQFTDARSGLGRSGVSLPTKELLEFQLAHAQARDAVHMPLDFEALKDGLETLAQQYSTLNPARPIKVQSQADDRMVYLQRPDLGRRVSDASRDMLLQQAEDSSVSEQAFDLAIVIGDGLSATAISENALIFIDALAKTLAQENSSLSLAPIVMAEQARVALGDDIGELLNARAVLVLIGERPGLSSPDSLGLYLTWAPRRGLTDEKRNCISNVRKAGLSHTEAVRKLLYLFNEACRLQSSGVAIKDRSDDDVIENSSQQSSFLINAGSAS